MIVHQFDAHAWAEVWLAGEGWVRVDPTAAVAPDRIEWGLERALEQEGSFLSSSPLSPLRYRSVIWINNMRLRYDALTWRWQKWIVGYDSERQYEFLQNWLGEISGRKFAMILLGSWALVLIPVGVFLLGRRDIKRPAPVDKYYLLFCRKLEKLGVVRGAGETPHNYSCRAGTEVPRLSEDIDRISRMYSDLVYANNERGQELGTTTLDDFKRAVRSLRP